MLQSKIFFLYGALAFVLSLVLTRVMMWVNIADTPGIRSSHSKVTPRSGGVGIIAGLFLVVLSAYVYGTFEGVPSKPILVIFSSSLFMAFIGLMDDMKGLTWLTRILVQVILATTVVLSGVTLKTLTLPYFGTLQMGISGDIIAVFWIIAFTNAFNFMDGINGISGGVALIASITLLTIVGSSPLMMFVIGLLPFAILGFLLFNFPKGKVFLGDVGSQFLGFLFACLGLILPLHEVSLSPLIVPMLFFIYIFETGFTVIRRRRKGVNVFSAHRDHLYQLLVRAGWSHALVAILYFIFFGIQGWLVTVMLQKPADQQILLFIPLIALYTAYTISVMKYAQARGVEL